MSPTSMGRACGSIYADTVFSTIVVAHGDILRIITGDHGDGVRCSLVAPE